MELAWCPPRSSRHLIVAPARGVRGRGPGSTANADPGSPKLGAASFTGWVLSTPRGRRSYVGTYCKICQQPASAAPATEQPHAQQGAAQQDKRRRLRNRIGAGITNL